MEAKGQAHEAADDGMIDPPEESRDSSQAATSQFPSAISRRMLLRGAVIGVASSGALAVGGGHAEARQPVSSAPPSELVSGYLEQFDGDSLRLGTESGMRTLSVSADVVANRFGPASLRDFVIGDWVVATTQRDVVEHLEIGVQTHWDRVAQVEDDGLVGRTGRHYGFQARTRYWHDVEGPHSTEPWPVPQQGRVLQALCTPTPQSDKFWLIRLRLFEDEPWAG